MRFNGCKLQAIQKERLIQVGFVAGGVFLYLFLIFGSPPDCFIGENGMILRDGYGGDARKYELMVKAESEGETAEIPVTVSVAPRSYQKEEAEQMFEAVMSRMEEEIRGENPSLMEVNHNLELPNSLGEMGIRLRWCSSEPEILDSSGKLCCEVEKAEALSLFVQLTADAYQANYEIPVRVVPDEKSEAEKFLSGLVKEMERLDLEQRHREGLQLPNEYGGKKLSYQSKKDRTYGMIPFLGVLLAVIWPARKQSEERKREKKREQELLYDYAELVSKMMILIGAGMTLRNVWERMVLDYESGLEISDSGAEYEKKRSFLHRSGKEGKAKRRTAYEEMRYTWYQMKNGLPESRAYQDFGRRCKLQPYLKLSSLLEQNRKTGTRDFRKLLQMELSDAFELRKNMARRMGEEAGTKLLVPLFLMLGIIMVMIMVPAMMTMG